MDELVKGQPRVSLYQRDWDYLNKLRSDYALNASDIMKMGLDAKKKQLLRKSLQEVGEPGVVCYMRFQNGRPKKDGSFQWYPAAIKLDFHTTERKQKIRITSILMESENQCKLILSLFGDEDNQREIFLAKDRIANPVLKQFGIAVGE